jgi:hypothetical protein
VQMLKNHAYNMCYPVCLRKFCVRIESFRAPCGAMGLVPCLVQRCGISLPAVGAECHTGLLLWLCRHPKLSAVQLAAAGVLKWGRDFLVLNWNNK